MLTYGNVLLSVHLIISFRRFVELVAWADKLRVVDTLHQKKGGPE